MQRLKMQLRGIINTILDARVHAHGMTEDEAMRLMLERGHQEEGEAVGKWRRALLTSTQLSTYYVGYAEVSDLVGDLRASRPELSERELHDLDIPDRLKWVPAEVPSGTPFNVAQMFGGLARAIRSGENVGPDFDDAVRLHRLLDAIQRSSDTGMRVTVPAA